MIYEIKCIFFCRLIHFSCPSEKLKKSIKMEGGMGYYSEAGSNPAASKWESNSGMATGNSFFYQLRSGLVRAPEEGEEDFNPSPDSGDGLKSSSPSSGDV